MDPDPCRCEGFVFRCVSTFVRACILLGKERRQRLPEDGITFSPSSPCFDGASSIVGGSVEACLQWICVGGARV